MRQRYVSPERNVRPGTEYARSIARYSVERKRPSSIASYLSHPLAPAIGLGLIVAGMVMLWPRSAQGSRSHEHDGDVEYADFPPRARGADARGLAAAHS